MKCRKCGGNRTPETCKLCDLFATHRAPEASATWTKPVLSDSMGVHTSQIAEAEARNRRHGCNVQYDRETGCAILNSQAEKRQLMKINRAFDKSAFM